jgi:hypothetical protein
MATSKTPPWKKRNPVKPAARIRLTPAQKTEANERAEAAGRRYPNLIDNMAIAKKAKATKRKTTSND